MMNFVTFPDSQVVNLSQVIRIEQIESERVLGMKVPEYMKVHTTEGDAFRVEVKDWDELWEILEANGLDRYMNKSNC